MHDRFRTKVKTRVKFSHPEAIFGFQVNQASLEGRAGLLPVPGGGVGVSLYSRVKRQVSGRLPELSADLVLPSSGEFPKLWTKQFPQPVNLEPSTE